MDDELKTRIENGVGYISFNRPRVLNALTPAFLLKVIDTVTQFENESSVRVLVLTGEGDAFSAGGDKQFLRDLVSMTPEQIRDTVYRSFAGAAKAVKLCRKPTVAAVNGPAVGAGCELAVACDFRIVTPKSFFHENWIDLGIIPPLGGMLLLPRLVGLERASNMIMRSQRVYGEEAVTIGLASKLVAPESLADETKLFAEELARRSPRALAVAKVGLRRGMEGTLNGEWEFNIQAQGSLISGPDFAEAVMAIDEKRKPVF